MDTAPAISVSTLRSTLGTPRAPFVIDVRRPPAFDADPTMIASALRRRHDAVDEWRGVPARYLAGGIEDWKAAGAPTVAKIADIGHAGAAATRWVTRERPTIDRRVACPWLVRRFIDPLAVFDYVPPERVLDAARATGAVPYDVPGVRFSHRGERCSFDAMIEDFALRDPALDVLATIVRGADTARLDLAPQAAGLLAVSLGLGRNFTDDAALLEAAIPVYDALYAWCREARGETHGWNFPS